MYAIKSDKSSMLLDHKKNALCDGYMDESIHDSTENYYEGGTYACRNCNNIKFPRYVSKILKLCLFCLLLLFSNKTTSKQRLDELFITKQEQKARNKNKIGLPPNKRYHLTPLARHNDFNDARIKDKN